MSVAFRSAKEAFFRGAKGDTCFRANLNGSVRTQNSQSRTRDQDIDPSRWIPLIGYRPLVERLRGSTSEWTESVIHPEGVRFHSRGQAKRRPRLPCVALGSTAKRLHELWHYTVVTFPPSAVLVASFFGNRRFVEPLRGSAFGRLETRGALRDPGLWN